MFQVEEFKVNDEGQAVQLGDNHGELAEPADRGGLGPVENSVKLPGFGLPVNYTPNEFFPSAALDWSGTVLTVRELNMMTIMDRITDKNDWDQKVFDDTIVRKWRQEALDTEGMDVSEKMLDWVSTTFLWDLSYSEGLVMLGSWYHPLLEDQRLQVSVHFQ